MATLDALTSRVRLELGDQPALFTTTLTGDGSTKDFYLKVKPVDAAYLTVTVNNVPKANPTDFIVEEALGMIHFVTAPAYNSVIKISGTHYRYFSTPELQQFVNTAVIQHTDNKVDGYGSLMTIAKLPAIEEYPVALAATIEALWALATDASFDINISAPDGVVIPRNQRFQQLSMIIANRQEQYRALCAALNVGLWRIEMGTLRRVSRTTNKLVPIYVAQEIDDARRPERVYLENNLKGRTPTPSTAGVYDIIVTEGDNWSVEFDFPLDFTEFVTNDWPLSKAVKAQIRTYPDSPTLAADISVTAVDLALGKVTLSLTSEQTKSLPVNSFWDVQVKNADGSFTHTYVRGLVFVTRQVTVD